MGDPEIDVEEEQRHAHNEQAGASDEVEAGHGESVSTSPSTSHLAEELRQVSRLGDAGGDLVEGVREL